MKNFIKTSEANSSERLELYREGKGRSEKIYYLEIVSSYSNLFNLKKAELLREAALLNTEGKYTEELRLIAQKKLAAATITGWNLEKSAGDYSKEAAENLLLTYPEIFDLVDRFSSNKENYIKKK